MATPQVSVVMGSQSDWAVLKEAANMLQQLQINYEAKVISAHRTPDLMFEFAENAKNRGIQSIIAGAGGAAHLPGMIAAKTELPVLGVPVTSKALNGVDSLLSIVQMPKGVPVATFAIGSSGAINAALFAASIVSLHDSKVATALVNYRDQQSQKVLDHPTLEET
jgi:5-(carboxyamino)imidazole ribonucleotide mutase